MKPTKEQNVLLNNLKTTIAAMVEEALSPRTIQKTDWPEYTFSKVRCRVLKGGDSRMADVSTDGGEMLLVRDLSLRMAPDRKGWELVLVFPSSGFEMDVRGIGDMLEAQRNLRGAENSTEGEKS